jgi:hypothetical protein
MTEEISKRKWSRIGCLGIIAAVIIVMAGIPGGIYGYYKYQTNKGINSAAERVSTYLEQKYHKKFNVFNGHYIWATSSYTFDASPSDDPEFKFPAFINKAFDKGIGDMYKLASEGREARVLIKPYIETISKNYFCSANFGPSAHLNWEKEAEPIMYDIRKNNLTPLKSAAKYPGKIYLNAGISYAFDITDQNKDQIFKGVFNLVEFLKQKNFGYIGIVIYFFPIDSDTGKAIINKTYRESKPGWTSGMSYSMGIGTNVLPDIKKWQDIEKYFIKRDSKK